MPVSYTHLSMPQGCHLPPPARHAEHAYRKGLLENHQPQTPCHRQRGMPLLPLQAEGALRQRLHEHAYAEEMEFCVEVLVNREVTDAW